MIRIMTSVFCLLAVFVCSCTHGPDRAEKIHREFRVLNLSMERKNDETRMSTDITNKKIAELEGKRWQADKYALHCTFQESDILRAHIDDWLEGTFPSLPRIPLDDYADQLDSRIRNAKSSRDGKKYVAQLDALQTYIWSLNGTEPREELFTAEIARRASTIAAQ